MRELTLAQKANAGAHDSIPLSRRSWIASTSAALAAGCMAPASRSTAVDRAAAPHPGPLPSDLPFWMRIAAVPGVSVAIVDRDRTIVDGLGVLRAGGNDPVNGDTVFDAASLSKPVFAYLVLRLADDGVIDLDRPLGDYLPLPNATDTAARPINARNVLSHTTGWRNWRNSRDHQLTADFPPGTRFGYSGEGYYFLQRVVERLTGKGIVRLTRERIFEPLGMRRSSYLSRADLEVNRAEPHSGRGVPIDSFHTRVSRSIRDYLPTRGISVDDWTHEEAERAAATINKDAPPLPNWLLPNVAGSLLTTANDYAIFLRHLLGLPGAPSGGRPVLDRMLASQISLNEAIRWGLGVGLQSAGTGHPDQFWHWGDSGGVKAFILGDPVGSSALVVFTNGNGGRAVYERVVRAIRGEDQPAFLWI